MKYARPFPHEGWGSGDETTSRVVFRSLDIIVDIGRQAYGVMIYYTHGCGWSDHLLGGGGILATAKL